MINKFVDVHALRHAGMNGLKGSFRVLVWALVTMPLQLVALLTDELTGKAVHLFTEYYPQPPFNTGAPRKATLTKTKSLRAEFTAKTQGNGS